MALADSSPGTLQLVTNRGNVTTNSIHIGASTSPTQAIQVTGSIHTTVRQSIGTTLDTENTLRVAETFTVTSGTRIGRNSVITDTPTSAGTAIIIGSRAGITHTSGANQGTLRGFEADVTSEANTISNMQGIRSNTGNSAGTVTDNKNFLARNVLSSTGTVTDSYGFYFEDPGAAGTHTNLYGMYLENVDDGATLNFAIYTNNGIVRFGDELNITADTTINVPAIAGVTEIVSGSVSTTIGDEGQVTYAETGASPAAITFRLPIPIPASLHGQAVTLRSGTFYYSSVDSTEYITANSLLVTGISDATVTDLDADTANITSGTSHAHTMSATAFASDETLILQLDIVLDAAGTVVINGAQYVFDTA